MRITIPLVAASIAVAGLGLAGCSLLPGGGGPTNPGDGETVDVFTLKVGDCLNDGGVEGEVSETLKVACTEPHDSEAYASIIVGDGDYPGEDAILAQAEDDCTAEFDSFVGLAYEESTLSFSYYFPTEASWAGGDREILCLLVDPAGKVTGSLEGSAR